VAARGDAKIGALGSNALAGVSRSSRWVRSRYRVSHSSGSARSSGTGMRRRCGFDWKSASVAGADLVIR
jgi:hypothetical protein